MALYVTCSLTSIRANEDHVMWSWLALEFLLLFALEHRLCKILIFSETFDLKTGQEVQHFAEFLNAIHESCLLFQSHISSAVLDMAWSGFCLDHLKFISLDSNAT